MIDNILKPIYTTQKKLDEAAHHDIEEYAENAHQQVREMAEEYGFTLRYNTRKGGHEPVFPPSSSEISDALAEVEPQV